MSVLDTFSNKEVKERIVLYGKTSFTYADDGSIEAGDYVSIAHGLGKTPFVDGMVKKGSSNWYPINTIKGTGEMVSCYADDANVYFYVFNGNDGTIYYFNYYLFFVEST